MTDELFLGLPSSWERVVVGDAGTVLRGRLKTMKHRSQLHRTACLRAANITAEGLSLADMLFLDFTEEERLQYQLQSGDIVLTEASGSEAHVGKCAVWTGGIEPCCFLDTVLRFRPECVRSEFAILVFRYFLAAGIFADASRGLGIMHLGATRFASLPFPLPPLGEQARIIERVENHSIRLGKAAGSLRRALRTLEEQRKNYVLERLLTTPEGHAAPMMPLGDVCVVHNGRAFKTEEWQERGLPIIRIKNLKDPTEPFNHFEGDVDDRHRVSPGALLYAWSGTPGSSFGAHRWSGPQAVLNQHIFRIDVDESVIDGDYLFQVLNSMSETFIGMARGGGGLGHITRGDFLAAKVPVPSLTDQRKILASLESYMPSIERQKAYVTSGLEKVSVLFAKVIEKAVTGGLKTQLASDIPAAVEIKDYHNIRRFSQKKKARAPRQSKQPALVFDAEYSAAPTRSLREVLGMGTPMKAQDLRIVAGYDADSTDDMDAFYKALQKALSLGEIKAIGRGADAKLQAANHEA